MTSKLAFDGEPYLEEYAQYGGRPPNQWTPHSTPFSKKLSWENNRCRRNLVGFPHIGERECIFCGLPNPLIEVTQSDTGNIHKRVQESV